MRVLLIKMSSLGDVVHTLAAVTDAVRALPEIKFDWVVEEAYAEIPRWHLAVRRVIPIGLRRWRKNFVATLRKNEWAQFRKELRRDSYDLILDAQGLMKSAWIGWQGRGTLAGRDWSSVRERLAATFYQKRHAIDLALPEVEQLRQLFSLALGYPQPAIAAKFGVDRSRLQKSYLE
ncbi:MAG TPA: lipopolysaccharide heptosyltransferase I, partial [Verrucomicrobiae bacterium]|nr:lipopolysaccharide heptosyltransferase I [Verrucomicrobiae bacterium]